MRHAITAALAAALIGSTAPADERTGYYYPPITSDEIFHRELVGGPPPRRDVRVRFITQVTKAQLAAPDNPRYVIFAKGDDADHMVIVALDDDVFKTVYRARAVLAQLTSNLRGTEFFIDSGLDTEATWFDLAKMLGFADVVVSDGDTWSHRVILE